MCGIKKETWKKDDFLNVLHCQASDLFLVVYHPCQKKDSASRVEFSTYYHHMYMNSILLLCVFAIIKAHIQSDLPKSHPDKCYTYDSTADLSIEDSAFMLVITQSGIGRYADMLLDDIEACVSDLIIPDIEEEVDLSISVVDFSITNIVFEELSVQDIDIVFQDPYITGSVSDASGKIKFSWQYSEIAWPYIGDQGWGEAELSDLSLLFSANFTMDRLCSTYDCNLAPLQLSVGDVDITLHGGASWLYDLLLELLTDLIVDVLIDPLATMLHDPLQQSLTDALANGNPIEDMGQDNDLLADLRFASIPSFGNGYISFPAVGRYETRDQEGMKPWDRPMPPLPTIQSDAAIQMFMGMPVFDSKFDAFYRSSKLEGNVTVDNCGDYAALLGTDVLSAYIPGLADYPEQDVWLNLTAVSVPTIVAQPVALFMNISGTIDILLDNTTDVLATIGVSYGLACNPKMETLEQYWGNSTCPFIDCTYYNQTAFVASSDIGEIDITRDFRQLLSVVGSEAVATKVTDLSSEYAIQIPASYISPDMVSTIIHVDSGFVEFNVDLTPRA
eukprot:gnl/Dysnectes_brevis/413_a455_5053.p1 GENE.gnl/Dysnectes_brevis/413_a455_5053~~gnl/Dysnectes_brevis/413_a455_5053.p1  ORF type:complete len:559 (+),score=71.99 gnl/Dysnectes_brevis/413_a455_5053:446-2122(+)